MDIENLSPELKEKACACRTTEELHELLKDEGMEIPDEQLEGIAGGAWCSTFKLYCSSYGCKEHAPSPCIR